MRDHLQRWLRDTVGVSISRAAMRQSMDGMLRNIRDCGFQPAWVVDVGAERGSWTAACARLFPAARYLLIEPREEHARDYLALRRRRGLDIVVEIVALGDAPGRRPLIIYAANPSGSTLLTPYPTDHAETSVRSVPVLTLDQLHERYGFERGLLKLDVQGNELRVLDGAFCSLANFEVVVLECSLYRFYPEQPLFGEVVAYMAERGYMLRDVSCIGYRPRDHALAQVDAVFVQESSQLQASHSWT